MMDILKIHKLIILIAALSFSSCRKDPGAEGKLYGVYTGIESFTKNEGQPFDNPDTSYVQLFEVKSRGLKIQFLQLGWTHSGSTKNSDFRVKRSEFRDRKTTYFDEHGSFGNSWSIELIDDSLFIEYEEHWLSNYEYWHFKGSQ